MPILQISRPKGATIHRSGAWPFFSVFRHSDAAKNLGRTTEILRYTQNDRFAKIFCRALDRLAQSPITTTS